MFLGQMDASGAVTIGGRRYAPHNAVFADQVLNDHHGGYPTGDGFVRGLLLKESDGGFLIAATLGAGRSTLLTAEKFRQPLAAARRADELASRIAGGFATGNLSEACRALRPVAKPPAVLHRRKSSRRAPFQYQIGNL